MTDQQQPNPIPAWAQQPNTPPVPGGWGPAPQPPQPPRNKHRGLKIAGGVVGVVIVVGVIGAAIGGSGKKDDGKSRAAAPVASASAPAAASSATRAAPAKAAPEAAKPKPKPKPDTVEYIVTGSPAQVTYGPAGSSLSGHSPMTVSKKLGHPTYYSVSAQLSGSGTVKCEIKVKGKVVSKATASGSYQIAMCEIVQDPIGGGWTDANSY